VRELIRNKWLYLMFLPVLIWYLVFAYWPMYGLTIAFQKYNIVKGVSASDWVGLKNFNAFFSDPYFFRLLRNTLLLSIYGLIFSFPVPILLALAFNEIRNARFKKITQTISYLPYFISSVVVCGMVLTFLSPSSGMINSLLNRIGIESIYFLQEPGYFRTIFISMGVWQTAGFSAIIYMAALAGISPELYEAARIDGANRWNQMRHITLPGLKPTIVILFILSMGGMLATDFEKIILLYNPAIYETSDVFNSYVYRRGLLQTDYSYAAAVGMFQSVVGFLLVVTANRISRKATETSLW
jgi:putative aldouronate transport system permease protein